MTTEFFVDLETGGVDEGRHPITEVSVLDVVGTVLLHRRVAVAAGALLEPDAVALNGYDPELWARTARPWNEVAAELARLFDVRPRPVLVGHYVHFEHRFLSKHMRDAGFDPDVVPATLVDTRALAHEHLGELHSGSLAWVAKVLGISPRGPIHRALEDADLARRAYLAMRRAGPIKRLVWRARAWWLRRNGR